MKKQSLYTLLCATLLTQILNAAEPTTPDTKIAKLKNQQFLSTPQIKAEVATKYDADVHSPDTREYYINTETQVRRTARNTEKTDNDRQINQLEFEKRLKLAEIEGERERQERLEEANKLVRKATEAQGRITQLENDIAAYTKEITEANQGRQTYTKQIADAQQQISDQKNSKREIIKTSQAHIDNLTLFF